MIRHLQAPSLVLFTNPGGPGGAGVGFLLRAGKGLRDVLDKPGLRHYEIVSFDPRGIGNSWPRANCFVHDTLRRGAIFLSCEAEDPSTAMEAPTCLISLRSKRLSVFDART